jgi:hypothetical protein
MGKILGIFPFFFAAKAGIIGRDNLPHFYAAGALITYYPVAGILSGRLDARQLCFFLFIS